MRPFMSKLKAKKKPEHKATVEGDAPRQRLDRPSRMRRADGGPTISEDSKKEAAKLRNQNLRDTALGSALAGGAGATLGRGIGRKIGAGVAAALGANRLHSAFTARDEANRIERGEAEPGKEDRKKGGRVCK